MNHRIGKKTDSMKIKNIQLKDFKRFTNTTIGDIPPEVRLVVMVGPNGCGKSSVIDAVNYWHRRNWLREVSPDSSYYIKQMPSTRKYNVQGNSITREYIQKMAQSATITFHEPQPASYEQCHKAVYVRTAYRHEADFALNALSHVGSVVEEQRSRTFRLIDSDQVVSKNYQRLASESLRYVLEEGPPEETFGEFRESLIGQLRDSMQRLFPGLVINSLGDPLAEGTFKFSKGDSSEVLYKNLSGGEKAAFDLLLDMLVKKREYNDTVFFIDEPEAHISVPLQPGLLKELLSLVPNNSQLWIATHSIGMMRKARELWQQSPGQVTFLDFDGMDFDAQTRIPCSRPDKPFWKRAVQVALDDIAGYVAPERVVLCEGELEKTDFDARCYNRIFSDDYPGTMFVGVGNDNDVQKDTKNIVSLLDRLTPRVNIMKLIDRDNRTDNEIRESDAAGVKVLSKRTIESYLLEDDVLAAVCCHLGGGEEQVNALLQAKQDALQNSIAAGYADDDLKRVAGDIYLAARKLFPHEKLGNNKRTFMSEFCASQVPECRDVYEQLRRDIFGE